MKKFISTTILTICFMLGVEAQETIFQIQLDAYMGEVEWKKYKNLTDIGIISTKALNPNIKSDNYTRVFIGKYLGEETAQAMAKMLRKRGFNIAFDRDDTSLRQRNGQFLNYTIQLGFYNSLNVSEFADVPYPTSIYIKGEGGKFRVFYGLYGSEDFADAALEELQSVGFEGVVKKFR